MPCVQEPLNSARTDAKLQEISEDPAAPWRLSHARGVYTYDLNIYTIILIIYICIYKTRMYTRHIYIYDIYIYVYEYDVCYVLGHLISSSCLYEVNTYVYQESTLACSIEGLPHIHYHALWFCVYMCRYQVFESEIGACPGTMPSW